MSESEGFDARDVDAVLSESNLEIVHADGTVTSKIDGIRRPYDDHVRYAHALAQVPRPAPAPEPEPDVELEPAPSSSSRPAWWHGVAAGGVGAALVIVVGHLAGWIK